MSNNPFGINSEEETLDITPTKIENLSDKGNWVDEAAKTLKTNDIQKPTEEIVNPELKKIQESNAEQWIKDGATSLYATPNQKTETIEIIDETAKKEVDAINNKTQLVTGLIKMAPDSKREEIPNILNEMNRGYVYGHDIESFTTVIRKLVEAAVKSDLTPSVLANLENYVCTKPEVYGFSNSDVEKYNKGVKILTATESELAQARVDQGLTNELKFGNALESISTEDKQKAI